MINNDNNFRGSLSRMSIAVICTLLQVSGTIPNFTTLVVYFGGLSFFANNTSSFFEGLFVCQQYLKYTVEMLWRTFQIDHTQGI